MNRLGLFLAVGCALMAQADGEKEREQKTDGIVIVKSSEDTRVYHTKTELAGIEGDFALDSDILDEIVSTLPGVAEASVTRYYIQVQKARTWTWEEVEPGILDTIRNIEPWNQRNMMILWTVVCALLLWLALFILAVFRNA